MDKTERVMVFIDGSNLYHSLKNFFKRADLDMGKFAHKLLEKRRLNRIYYYNARVGQQEEPDRYRDQQAFFFQYQRYTLLRTAFRAFSLR